MKLVIVDAQGNAETVTENLENYNFDKPLASAQVILDITNAVKKMQESKDYEVVDFIPATKIPGFKLAFDYVESKKSNALAGCVRALDEMLTHCDDANDIREHAQEAYDAAMKWQDVLLRVISDLSVTRYEKVDDKIKAVSEGTPPMLNREWYLGE